MALECKKCPYLVAVPPGEKPPPWCPRCGSDLKAATPVTVGMAAAGVPGFSAASTSNVADVEVRRHSVYKEAPELEPAPPALPADEEALATPQEVFPSSLVWQALAWGCVIVCFGIAAVAVSQLIHPPLRKPTQMGVYGVLGLFSIGGLVSLYVGYRLAGQKYEVFADRLVEWQCFTPTTFRWEQIREIFQDVQGGWTTYRVVTRTGRRFTLRGEIKNHKRLGKLISERVAALLLPAALHELASGREVHFGPLRVGRAGVVVDGELQPWHRIGVLTFGLNPKSKSGNALVSNRIHLRLGSCWVEIGEIPNYRLFEELARRLFPACVGY